MTNPVQPDEIRLPVDALAQDLPHIADNPYEPMD
jgi:hypothetical protein